MRRVDVRELSGIKSIAIDPEDFNSLMENKAYRRTVQLLYGTVDSLYTALLDHALTDQQMHFIRGRISAIEEILRIREVMGYEAKAYSRRPEGGEVPDGDDAFRAALEQLEGTPHV